MIMLLDEGGSTAYKMSETVKNVLLQQLLGNAGIKSFSAHTEFGKKDFLSNDEYLKAAWSIFHKPVSQVRAHVEFFQRF